MNLSCNVSFLLHSKKRTYSFCQIIYSQICLFTNGQQDFSSFQMFGSRSRHTHYQQSNRSYFGVLLLLAELSRSSHLPPITLVVIILNVVIYFDIFPLFGFTSDLQSVCVSTHAVLDQGDYWRILLAPLFHGDDMHLYYNMASFLYKGQQLETLFGSRYFALLLTVLTVSSSLMLVLLGQLAASVLDNPEYLFTCAVGFSAVIFALKVITTHYTPEYSTNSFLGGLIPISTKYAVWAELIIIQLITPNVSFLGHLAGILVGLLYIYGPFRYVCNNLYNLIF